MLNSKCNVFYISVPNAPDILSYVSEKWNEFKVQRIASAIGPSTTGFEMFHRLETTNPDGAWSFRNQEMPTGSCDFSASWCHAWGVQAFHNYTVRIIPFNEEGFGFATDPYRLTTKENSTHFSVEILLVFCLFKV